MRLGTAALRHPSSWEAHRRATREQDGHGAAPPWDRNGTGIGSANAITGPARTGARLCVGGINAGVASMALGTALPWDWGQRWQSAQGRVTALLGPRPEPAHLPEAGLRIAQGLAASPLWP